MLTEVVINFASNDSALFKVKAIQTFFIFILISIFKLFVVVGLWKSRNVRIVFNFLSSNFSLYRNSSSTSTSTSHNYCGYYLVGFECIQRNWAIITDHHHRHQHHHCQVSSNPSLVLDPRISTSSNSLCLRLLTPIVIKFYFLPMLLKSMSMSSVALNDHVRFLFKYSRHWFSPWPLPVKKTIFEFHFSFGMSWHRGLYSHAPMQVISYFSFLIIANYIG